MYSSFHLQPLTLKGDLNSMLNFDLTIKMNDGTCVDTSSDPNNCGGCNIKCTAPSREVSRCIDDGCTTPTCREGTTKCDGICLDTQSDDYNCGSCGFACHCYEGDPRCCLYHHTCLGPVPHCREGVCSV